MGCPNLFLARRIITQSGRLAPHNRNTSMDLMETVEPIAAASEPDIRSLSVPNISSAADCSPLPRFSRELLALAAPLILSQSFMTVQVFVDTILLAWHDPREMAASFPAMMWYWLGFGLLQVTAGYTSTFVAQYTGAGRPHRVGPAVWQGIHFAVLAGLLFLLVVPAAPMLIALGGHTPALQALESAYLRCLACAAMPMLVMSAVNG